MSIQNNSPALGESAGPKNTALIDTFDTKNPRQKIEVPQEENDSAPGQFAPQPFPSFFELVAKNAEEPMRRASVYLRICAELISIGIMLLSARPVTSI
jgi:hypothetical protein